ncbi:MAG: hypothetical protein JSU62_10910, partial [Gammaproteobacteria bacterium]
LEVEHQRITRVRVALGDAWREREAPAEGATEADQEAVQQAEVSAEEATPDNGNAADRPAREG